MIIKLWYPCKGEFCKEYEIFDMPLPQIIRHDIYRNIQRERLVFIYIGEKDYEFDHIEKGIE